MKASREAIAAFPPSVSGHAAPCMSHLTTDGLSEMLGGKMHTRLCKMVMKFVPENEWPVDIQEYL